jgi:hypothetical protein
MLRWALPVLALATVSGAVRANDRVYQRVLASTAWVLAGDTLGSGVVVDQERRLVATNFHVVGMQAEVRVVFPDFQDGVAVAERQHYLAGLDRLAVKGKVFLRDPRRDLALVQLERLPDGVLALPLAPASAAPGRRVHSVGNPGASDALWVYSSGTVRQVYHKRYAASGGPLVEARVLETQSPINSGDSGGPVVNDRCQLVGIVTAFRAGANLVTTCIDVAEVRGLLRGEVKTIDAKVRASLEQSKLKYAVNDMGVFRLAFTMRDGGSQFVYIDSQTQLLAESRYREVWATAQEVSGPLNSTLANRLLELNRKVSIGAWEVRKSGTKGLVVFCARIPADAETGELKATLQAVLGVSYALKKELSSPAK